jgi:hypothetical protein
MPISEADFRAEVLTRRLADVVKEHIFSPPPFAFQGREDHYADLVQHLTGALGVNAEQITIVGSGKTGFSTHPEKYGTPFRAASDIDVVIVDASMFDRLWLSLAEWDYRMPATLTGAAANWKRERRREVFRGYLLQEQLGFRALSQRRALAPVRELATRWFATFQGVGLYYPLLAGRTYKGRLYRTWDHALSYHVHGLRQIRASLINQDQSS